MRRRKKLLLFGFVVLVLAALVVHETGLLEERHGPDNPPRGGERAEGSATVGPTVAVTRTSIALRRRAVGSVQARSPVAVAARVMAAVLEIGPRVGDHVEAGDLVALLDDRDLAARVSAAEAALAAARSRAKAAEAEASRARAESIRASSERERMQQLFEQEVATARQLEVAVAEDESARATVEATEAGAIAAGSGIQVAEKDLEAAVVGASHARIVAPSSGVVARRLVEPGEIVLPGRALIEVYDPSDLRIEVAVPEADASRLGRLQQVRVLVPSAGLDLIVGIDEIVPAADPTTRSVLVKTALPQIDELREGVRGTMVYAVGEREVLSAPLAAVQRRGQVESVRVLLSSGELVRRHVRTGEHLDEGRVEILSGLVEGEQVEIPEADR